MNKKNKLDTDETIATVELWHISTFPDASEKLQQGKILEELDELKAETLKAEATSESIARVIEELADVCIAAYALSRWTLPFQHAFLVSMIFDAALKMTIQNLSERMPDEHFVSQLSDPRTLQDAINRKMEINRQRTWVKDDAGIYHHEGKHATEQTQEEGNNVH